ncbi:MAG: hypothetical protein LWX01_08370 [Deltaproteobacteria bacterium]|nr:hypothetical protein [Deltaproteobacteria bacterium]MDL1961696.1 hypothetical protein [Deltaproteobacteria bacterium]
MIIRKIGIIGRTYRHAQRYRHILSVLFKYGFGDMVDILKVEQYLELGLQMISRKRREKEPDIQLLQRDTAEFMDQYLYLPLKELEMGKIEDGVRTPGYGTHALKPRQVVSIHV